MEDNVASAPVRVVRPDPAPHDRRLPLAGVSNSFATRCKATSISGSGIWLQPPTPRLQARGRPVDPSAPPSDAAELGRYDALLLVDPDMLGPRHPMAEMIMNLWARRGRLIFVPGELSAQQLLETDDAESEGNDKLLPVVAGPACSDRGPGAFEYANSLPSGTDPGGAGRPDLRVPLRPRSGTEPS